MSGKKLNLFLLALFGGLLLFILWNSFSQAGVQDLEGDFRRLAFSRNENNTGPVKRVYAVSLSDTLWQEMKQYGDFMPHTKYGNTRVYFFLENQPHPITLGSGPEKLDPAYRPYCLAKYEKDAMGNISFIRFPFL